MLPGLSGLCGKTGPAPIDLSYRTFGTSTSVTTSHTFGGTAFDIGDADADRTVIVVIGFDTAGTGTRSVSSCTVGGVSGSHVVTGSYLDRRTEIWTADVPTGTTATITVVTSGTSYGCSVIVYRAVGLGTLIDSGGTGSTSTSLTLNSDAVAGGATVAGAYNTSAGYSSASTAWSGAFGVVEDADVHPVYNTGRNSSAASLSTTGAKTNEAITMTTSGSSSYNTTLAFATWEPS